MSMSMPEPGDRVTVRIQGLPYLGTAERYESGGLIVRFDERTPIGEQGRFSPASIVAHAPRKESA